jgi:hypothetical protein
VRMNKINKKIKYLRVNQKDGGAEGQWSLRGRQQATRTPDDVRRQGRQRKKG